MKLKDHILKAMSTIMEISVLPAIHKTQQSIIEVNY